MSQRQWEDGIHVLGRCRLRRPVSKSRGHDKACVWKVESGKGAKCNRAEEAGMASEGV